MQLVELVPKIRCDCPAKEGLKDDLPANWRIYEFRLRYPNGMLDAEILHLNLERDVVIVKAMALESEQGHGEGTGLKQGKLSILDKVEKLAKSRAVADVGIDTEYALEACDDDLEDEGLDVVQATSPTAPAQQPAPVAGLEEGHAWAGCA